MNKKITKTKEVIHADPYGLRRLEKPKFVHVCMESQSFYRVRGVIPTAGRLALIDALPKRLNEAIRVPFVDDVLKLAELTLQIYPKQSGQSCVSQLRDIEQKARALLVAMARMEATAMGIFARHGGDFVCDSQTRKNGEISPFTRALFAPDVSLPAGAELAEIWDVVQDVENIAHIAAGHLHPKKGKRPNEVLAKGIVWGAATLFKAKFAKVPPITESGWFAVWLSVLGQELGHPFSAKQAATGLKRWLAEQSTSS
jgi:hypothetical protein